MPRNITRLLTALALGVLLSATTFADPPADKGKGQSATQPAVQGGKNQSSSVFEDAAKAADQDKSRNVSKDRSWSDDDNYDPYQDKYQGSKADSNHGQRVSDCNHRANTKQMKGQERQQFVEWCVDNGERYKYDDRRWTGSRTCYQKADDRNLSGDARRRYVNNCLSSTIFR